MSDIASLAGASDVKAPRITAILPVAAVVALAIILRAIGHLNTDVSWLLTLGEKMLSGARPYVDFLEVNPPASILLYLPAVLIGHALNVAPEFVVNVLVFAGTAASLRFCASLLVDAQIVKRRDLPLLGSVAAFVLLVLPCYAFAQREHIALVAMLPLLCLYAVRAAGVPPSNRAALIAGLLAGVAIAIKVYFAPALLLPFSFVIWKRRHERGKALHLVFATENLAVIGVVLAYVAIVFWAFPDFLRNELPLLTTLYTKVSKPFAMLLVNPSCILFALGVGVSLWIAGSWIRQPLIAVTLLAAFGFFVAALVQGKGWPYHGYPAIALILLVVGSLLILPRESRAPALIAPVYVLLAAASAYWFSFNAEPRGLLEALRDAPLSHPKVLAIAGDIGVGHPLTRRLNGSWAGTSCSLWVTEYANRMLATVAVDAETARMLARYKASDRAALLHDIGQNRPDMILIDGQSWHDWAMSDRAIRTSLVPYRRDRTVNHVEIWLRRTHA